MGGRGNPRLAQDVHPDPQVHAGAPHGQVQHARRQPAGRGRVRLRPHRQVRASSSLINFFLHFATVFLHANY